QSAALAGTAGFPSSTVVVSPDPMPFGDVPVGSGAHIDYTLTNNGSSDLHISDLQVSGNGFFLNQVLGSCYAGATVPAGGSCAGRIEFHPTSAGDETG